MDGVAGHAGLFTTAEDLARFSRMLLGGGQLDGVRILSEASVAEMTRVQTDGSNRRGNGHDVGDPWQHNQHGDLCVDACRSVAFRN